MASRQNVRGRWITAFSTTLRAQGAEFVMEPARGWTPFGPSDWIAGGMLSGFRSRHSVSPARLRQERRAVPAIVEAPAGRHAIGHQLIGHQLINEELFRGVLARERRRADRFDEVFAVLVVELTPAASDSPSVVNSVIGALASSMRESDVLGWIERPAVIGVVLAPVQSLSRTTARDLEERVRRELAGRVTVETLVNITVRLHVHEQRPIPGSSDACDALPSELQGIEQPGPVRDSLKRMLDIAGSAMLLALLSPLLLLIAVLVKLSSPGPVLFRQLRVGQSAKPFTMLKFRTMKANAEHALHQKFVTDFIKSGGQKLEPGDTKLFKIADDPRVTPLGRILRRTSLDELPQLWNVLIGDMSLVGPRPPLHYEVEQYRSWHWRRVLEAKPGVTGLWQVAGRSRTTFDEMVRLDLRYVRTRSLWTDVKILLATPRAVVTGRGAC
jgi:lipopolysaccharide/colanic/teichoic acid biosynthesis glycosyltransferase